MGYVGKVTVGGATHLVGSTLYGTCATAAGTAAKVVTCTDFTTLMTGITIHVKFTYSNTTSNPTLNVNSTGAKAIYRYGTTRPGTVVAESWNAGSVVSFTYDGTNWVMNDYSEGSSGGNFVSYSQSQSLTDAQKYQARVNIGAGVDNSSNTVSEIMYLMFDGDDTYSDNPTGTPDVYLEFTNYLSSLSGDFLYDFQFEFSTEYVPYEVNIVLRYGRLIGGATWGQSDNTEEYHLYSYKHEVVEQTDPDYDSSWMDAYLQSHNYIIRLSMVFQTNSIRDGRSVTKTVTIKTFQDETYTEFEEYDSSTDQTVYPYRIVTYSVSPNISTNVSVPASAWVLQSTPTYAAFPYRASITVPWITADMTPEVIFSPDDAISGNYAPVADTATNTVYIYAKSEGAVAITIPTVSAR